MSTLTIKKAYADTPHGQLHYRYTLPPSPPSTPILFLHMSASSSASMESLMRHYTALHHPCYAPDMPGFGNSFDPSVAPPSIAWYVDLYVRYLIPTLGLAPGAFHLVGHHSGAVIGLEMAVLHPSLLRSVTLVGPAVMSAEGRAAMREKYSAAFNEPEASGQYLMRTFEYLSGQAHNIPRGELDLLHRETMDHVRAWRGRTQIYSCVWGQDSERLLKEVRTPVLAMCARDDVLWRFVEHFKALRGDLRFEEITGGNFCLDRGTQSIVEKLTPWIDELDKNK